MSTNTLSILTLGDDKALTSRDITPPGPIIESRNVFAHDVARVPDELGDVFAQALHTNKEMKLVTCIERQAHQPHPKHRHFLVLRSTDVKAVGTTL